MAKKKSDKETEPKKVSTKRFSAFLKNETTHFVIGLISVIFAVYLLLERARDMKCYDFVDTALKILPLLYLKATLLPPCEPIGEDEPETFVTEEDYELIRRAIAGVLGAKDDYLEVFLPDMVYSDTPIKKCISEDLADIYQDLKDFISVFQLGLNETMNDSLVVCKEHFREFWGQRLVNTMRALHDVKYSPADDGEEEEMEDENSLL